MIEIILLIIAVKAFMKKAESKKLNKNRWGLYGALSYLVPVLFSSFVILPILINLQLVQPEGLSLLGTAMVLNLTLGVLSCFALYQYLRRKEDPVDEKPEILDHFR